MGIVAKLYDRDDPNGAPLATLTRTWGRGWRDERGSAEPGSGELSMLASHPAAPSCGYRNIVRFYLDDLPDAVFGFVISDRPQATLRANDGQQVMRVMGDGLLSLFSQSVVQPARGIGRNSPGVRRFDYAAMDLPTDDWGNAVHIKGVDQVAIEPYPDAPEDFEDGDADWIDSRVTGVGTPTTPPYPVGDSFFRQTFTLDNETNVRLVGTGDDGVEFVIDEQDAFAELRAFLWREKRNRDVLLDAGSHLLAAKRTNMERESVETNRAGICWTLMEVLDGGAELGVVIAHSDSTVLAKDYPIPPPGYEPGRALIEVIEENQANGELADITFGFTETHDSDNVAWATRLDLKIAVGSTVLEFIEKLCEAHIDVWIDPETLTLHAWNKGTMLADLTGTVTVDDTTVTDMDHDGEDLVANDVLVQYDTGKWTRVDDASSVAVHGRIVDYAQLGDAGSLTQVEEIMQAFFADNAEPVDLVRAGLLRDMPVGQRPYHEWLVGDVVTGRNRGGGTADVRTTVFTVTELDPSVDGREGGTVIVSVQGLQGTIGGS